MLSKSLVFSVLAFLFSNSTFANLNHSIPKIDYANTSVEDCPTRRWILTVTSNTNPQQHIEAFYTISKFLENTAIQSTEESYMAYVFEPRTPAMGAFSAKANDVNRISPSTINFKCDLYPSNPSQVRCGGSNCTNN